MRHSVHNGDIGKELVHTTSYTLYAICLVQLKLGLIREEHTSLACQWPSNVSIFPLKSGQNPGEDDEQADEFPLDGF
jgi:hypothetical protein